MTSRTLKRGDLEDTGRSWEGLIVEASQWLKLSSLQRREAPWREAQQVYEQAGVDPAFVFPLYLRVALGDSARDDGGSWDDEGGPQQGQGGVSLRVGHVAALLRERSGGLVARREEARAR